MPPASRRNYVLMSNDDEDDMLVATMAANERDHRSHQLNAERYEAMLAAKTLDPEWTTYIQNLLFTERLAMNRVAAILDNTLPQLPPQARIDASAARLRAKGHI